jgi:hypothetical protein
VTTQEAGTRADVHAEAAAVLGEMRASVEAGEDWFGAVMTAIRRWPLSAERVGEREFQYLVGGEAFDWLLLAERLCLELGSLAPDEEVERLLFGGKPPIGLSEEDMQQMLGVKYKAHLNFVYGVRLEGALQVAVGEEVRKEHHGGTLWGQNGRLDDEMHERIYGKPFAALMELYREDRPGQGESFSLAELDDWRYWLFQYRMRNCDPEKVASDTRKGLTVLRQLESCGRAIAPGGDED